MSANVLQKHEFTEVEKVHWEKWKQGAYDGLTDAEIGKQLHRTDRTIRRLKHKAKLNGEYQKWADEAVGRFHEEYWELHRTVKKKNVELAYVETGKRVDKTLIAKIKLAGELTSKVVGPPPIDIDGLSDYERKLLTDAAILYWRERNKTSVEPVKSIH
jgi:hypothetical protein